MPKYRKLYVKTVESLDLNEMPDDTFRLFWVLLPTQLCREGRGLDNPAWIKSRVFPLRQDISTDKIAEMMDWLEKNKMIARYEAEGRKYFNVPTFHKYQGDCTKEAESNFPPPDDYIAPELVESKSRVSKEKSRSGVGVTESASTSVNESESIPFADPKIAKAYSAMQDHTSQDVAQLYRDVTGQMQPLSANIDKAFGDLELVLDYYPSVEDAIAPGKYIYDLWCQKRSAKTGKTYSPLNIAWIEKWLENLARDQEKAKVAEQRERSFKTQTDADINRVAKKLSL